MERELVSYFKTLNESVKLIIQSIVKKTCRVHRGCYSDLILFVFVEDLVFKILRRLSMSLLTLCSKTRA